MTRMDRQNRRARVGIDGGTTRQMVLPLPRWWQERPVRVAVGTLVAVVLLGSSLLHSGWSDGHWSFDLPGGTTVQTSQHALLPLAALMLMPFMPLVSYRKRDVLLVALVPVVGPMLAGIMVCRLLSLPRRDWPPRPDWCAQSRPSPSLSQLAQRPGSMKQG
jgi:hypothetical protein